MRQGLGDGFMRFAHPLHGTDGEGGRGQIGEGHIGSPQRVHSSVRTAPAQWAQNTLCPLQPSLLLRVKNEMPANRARPARPMPIKTRPG